MSTLSLALDWTPNANHCGFFVARELGFYSELDVDLKILSPQNDDYKKSPAKKVELGEADIALCPTESLISYQTKNNSFPLKAIGAILREDLSAIAMLQDHAVERPQHLDGKTYASYKAHYEDQIVKELIKNDGGKGDLNIIYPERLGIWETLLTGKADATWVFTNWEGVLAETDGIELSYFRMKDYDIPYSYSPVMAVNAKRIESQEAAFRSFLKATKKGFLYTQDHIQEAVDILKKHLPENEKQMDLAKALSLTAPFYGNNNNWGKMDKGLTDSFLQWIYENRLEEKELLSEKLFTNHLL